MAYFRKRDNGWEYRISYKAPDGSFKQKSKGGFATKKLAQSAASKTERLLNNNVRVDDKQTFLDYYHNWAEIHKKPNVTPVTWKKYQHTESKVKLYFKDTKLTEITNSMYQQVLNQFASTHTQETVEKFHYQVKAAVKMAVHEGIIERNFCDFAIIRSTVESFAKETKFLEMEEYTDLIRQTREKMKYHSYAIIYLIAVTGMRFAEAVGLTWDDIDFENGLIDINKTYNYNTTFDFAPTKNSSSMRKVPIDDQTINLLIEYREKYWIENDQNRIFASVSNAAANKTIKKIVGRNVHIHSLRHTYASYLITQGVELISISQLLGHENLNITLKVYAHQLESLKEKSNDKVRKIFEKFGADITKTLVFQGFLALFYASCRD
ncbi:site-specific integrase [Streptococcus suis]|uniref:site-specific integrase n=1 Tax=Streptococcus suis TaxID=1307 RepID=UPI000696BE53|nr:tyrosine-type recombinase/integrase [Streptococcus suis]MDY7283708.1 tyrosine-type recombinase/integrase [Streptococcus suis]NQG77552.1 site-specific integrase [Streptococcus suis]NQH60154.1 site-specific integrase [Streptococcus suis]NQN48086.1 site-specific integrase [Streptococcus suis]NQN56048.1 site-specific integrase [Streptococcus suis]